MKIHEKYMRRCLQLAKMGEGNVAPNPMVGAVIVCNNKIIGEGYHQEFGGPHAEVNAINSVKDKSLLAKSTIYVSLEPCAHHGKTPPCSDLIVEHKIPKVVIGSQDTFSKVNGKGIKKLEASGCQVTCGVLEKECRELNKRFFTFHEKKRPYVILKWAQTKDGFLDKTRNEGEKGIHWITAPETRSLVHLWRSKEMGILVGRQTAAVDDPKLNVRDVTGKNPVRIILDSQLKLNHQKESKNVDSKTIVFNTKESKLSDSLEFIQLKNMEVAEILHALWEKDIQSIIVEGGAHTLQHFLLNNAWDEIRILEGNKEFGEGLKAPSVAKLPHKLTSFGEDKIYYFRK